MSRVRKSFGLGLVLSLFALPGVASSWNGFVDWSYQTPLSTPLSGVVASVPVKQGERVKKGQLLLALEQGALRARVAQRQAELKYRELMRTEATKELERAEELYARTLLADHDLDTAKIAYAEADAAYQASRAEHLQAKEDLDNSALYAPYDAIVLTRNIHPAQTVISRCETQPLLTLAPAQQMRVRIVVQANQVESLRGKDSLAIEVAGKRYQGSVESISLEPVIAKEQGGYPVDVLFSSDEFILIGQEATVTQP